MAFSQNWEISLIELENDVVIKYKVTRRMPEYSVAETKVFFSKKKAKQQLEEWLEGAPPSSSQEGQ